MKFRARHLTGVVLLALSACGGGGGGGGGEGGSSPLPAPPPVVSLLPTAPALGATLYSDATVLRPLRDGAVWQYRGTQTSPLIAGSPVAYTTATTQAATSANAATEDFSNTGNAGPDSQPLNFSAGTVSFTVRLDFTGKGMPETVQFVELRSPVRTGDQITMLEKRYTDTAIDNDGDGRPDVLDVALYARVIGPEMLALPGLPTLDTVRVDTTLRQRVTPSSTSTPGAITEVSLQTWYAAGIGIVRQRSSAPAGRAGGIELTDEQLVSWDGISGGFGAMPTQDAVQPATAGAVAGQVLLSSAMRAFAFPGHTLVFTGLLSDPTRTLASRFDLRGRVLDGRFVDGVRVRDVSTVAQLSNALVLLDTPPGGGMTSLRLTRFAADGSLDGPVGAASVDLAGTRLVPSLGAYAVAGDRDRFWLLFSRGYRDTDPLFTIRSEWVLRAFSANGTPLTAEFVLALDALGLPKLTADRGRLLLSWVGPGPGYAVRYGSVDAVTGTLTARTLASDLPSSSSFVTPLLLDTGGALLWPAALGSGAAQGGTAGVRLDASFEALRSDPNPAAELLAGLPTYDSLTAAPGALGTRLVLSTPDAAGGLAAPPQGNGATRVSWIEPVATAPLKAGVLNAVSFEAGSGLSPRAQALYGDRVLVFSGDVSGFRLRSTVVWLNDGKAR